MGAIFLNQERYTEALEALRPILTSQGLYPDDLEEMTLLYAQAAYGAGRPGEAVDELRKAGIEDIGLIIDRKRAPGQVLGGQ